MGLRDFFSRNNRAEELQSLYSRLQTQDAELRDVKALLKRESEQKNKLQEYLRVSRSNIPKPLQFSTKNITGGGDRRNTAQFEGPLYDLQEIARAIDIEAYISTSVRKHREQILKEGYQISGQDQETVDYVNQRLFEFFLVSGVPFDEVLREFTTNLVQYASSFIVKVRDRKASTGRTYRWRDSWHEPIAAIFPMDPTTVGVQQNSLGHVTRWEQRVSDSPGNQRNVKRYKPDEVVLATIDKKSGFVFGTPYILPVLDDVRTLRRIEEITEVLTQRHAFPWTHWKVGSDEFPALDLEDGTSEVDAVRGVIQSTPPEGGIVTDWRVTAEVLGMEGEAISLEPYLEYFEQRVMAGLRLSPQDLGRSGSSKADAVTISETLQDASKDFQDILSKAITYQLFVPLLLEGGFSITRENLVFLQFQLINREEERARQAHGNDLWLSGSISRTELRKDFLNKKELADEEREECHIEIGHKNDIELAKIAAAAKAANAAKSTTAAKNKSANKTRPRNQSGRKPTKTRVKANDIHLEFYIDALLSGWQDTRNMLEAYTEKYTHPIEDDGSDPRDVTTRETELTSILDSLTIFFSRDSKSLLLPVIQAGVRKAALDAGLDEYEISNRAIDRFIKNNITKYLKIFTNSLENEINSNNYISGVDDSIHPQAALMSILENRTDELVTAASKHISLAYRFGFVKGARAYGYKSFIMIPEEGAACEDCLDAGEKEVSMLQRDIPYSILLSTHGDCEYTMKFGQK